ncbi:hypothetical protein Tco_0451456 [Tanacetum coccineum]
MAGLEFCSKHNMVAYLEKTDGNTEFHQIMDFLIRSSIYYALTSGKPVTISEASIRSDLLFDDVDGIDSLNNQAIFDNIQLMGQPQTQTVPSPRPSPSIVVPDPEGSGGNHGGQSSNDASLSGNEDGQEAKERSQTTYHTSQSLDEDKIGKEDFSEENGLLLILLILLDVLLDYMETVDAQDERRISSVVLEDKENADKEVSTEAPVSTVKPNEGTNKKNVSTVKPNEGTDKKNEGTDKQDGGTNSTKVSTDRQGEGTIDQNEGKSATQTAPTTTSTPTLTIFDTERPKPTSTRSILTLRPLPKIDPKGKGKKRIKEEDESDTESEGITEAEKKFKQLANDEEVARKVQEEWEAEEEKKKHVGGKKHANLKNKNFEEIQVLYKKVKRSNKDFIANGSAEDKRQIKEMNEESKEPKKKRLKKRVVNETSREEDTAKC